MYSFHLENFEKWLAGFAEQLDASITDHILDLPPQLGEGIILAQNVNPHFSYAVMNFKFDCDLELQRESGAPGFVRAASSADGDFSLAASASAAR